MLEGGSSRKSPKCKNLNILEKRPKGNIGKIKD
jgi:hypothetical protein